MICQPWWLFGFLFVFAGAGAFSLGWFAAEHSAYGQALRRMNEAAIEISKRARAMHPPTD